MWSGFTFCAFCYILCYICIFDLRIFAWLLLLTYKSNTIIISSRRKQLCRIQKMYLTTTGLEIKLIKNMIFNFTAQYLISVPIQLSSELTNEYMYSWQPLIHITYLYQYVYILVHVHEFHAPAIYCGLFEYCWLTNNLHRLTH